MKTYPIGTAPCPYCGGRAAIIEDQWLPSFVSHIYCDNCEWEPDATPTIDDAQLVEDWNRATMQAEVVKCQP